MNWYQKIILGTLITIYVIVVTPILWFNEWRDTMQAIEIRIWR